MPVKVQSLSVDAACEAFRSGADGIDDAEAARRLAEFGPNEIERFRKVPPALMLLRQLIHFFAVILWVAAGLALAAELRQPGHGMGTLAGAIVAVIGVNGLFAFWREHRAERALEALERLLPIEVLAVRGGLLRRCEARALVPGDVVLLEGGQRVPADTRVVEARDLRVNNATLTGESVAQWRDAAPSDEVDLARASNVMLAGTSVVSGSARALVVATGAHTEFARIARLAQAVTDEPSPLQKEIGRLSRIIALLAAVLGALFFGAGVALGVPLWHNLVFAIGILVANVPEGLLPTVTLALAMASQRMARRHVIVRHLPAVETLGAATVICTDKTGTLTENRMAARTLYLAGQLHDARDRESMRRAAERHRGLFEAIFYCENIKEAGGPAAHELLGDPMEVALVELAGRTLGPLPERPRLHEIPFDPDRRRLSTVYEGPHRPVLYTKGALESVLPLCSAAETERGPAPLTEDGRRDLVRAENELAERGLRVLAVASRELPADFDRDAIERGLVVLGLVALEDPPRTAVPDAIRRCREVKIRVVMVTGDHPRTAVAIGREIGLVSSAGCRLITGAALRHMEDTQLQLALDAPELVFARVGADQKTRIVRALQRKGEVVAVTGDGVNDAPALRAADIGIAMGQTGTDVARESADMVLADDNFASIVGAVEEGRAVYQNIRKFLTYILASNVPEIVPYIAFVLARIPLPLTIVQILAVDLGTDMLPALGLGAEPPEPRDMRRPPRPRSQRLLSAGLLVRAYGLLGVVEAVAAMSAYFFVLERHGWTFGQALGQPDPVYLQATSACLTAIVLMQVVNVFVCRSDQTSALAGRPWQNRLLVAGVTAEVILLALILYTPPGQAIFGTAPLPAGVWLLVAPFAAAMLALDEVRKRAAHRSLWAA